MRFWKPSEIALRSLIFPSWGDFIMGHYFVASIELMSYLFSWLVALGFVLESIPKGEGLLSVMLSFLGLAFVHVVDYGLTYSISKKGLIPRSAGAIRKEPIPVASRELE